MRVLVIGGGGREHALAWKLAREKNVHEVFLAPGNPGIALEPKIICTGISAGDFHSMAKLCRDSGAPLRLRDVGVPEKSLPMLAKDAMLQTRLLRNNPVDLTEKDALALYRAAF